MVSIIAQVLSANMRYGDGDVYENRTAENPYQNISIFSLLRSHEPHASAYTSDMVRCVLFLRNLFCPMEMFTSRGFPVTHLSRLAIIRLDQNEFKENLIRFPLIRIENGD